MLSVDYQFLSQAELDWNYTPSLSCPTAPQILEEWGQKSAQMRAEFTQNARLNCPYGTDARQIYDLWHAKNSNKTIVIFIHGGFWQMLSKDSFSHLGREHLANGADYAVINYRLCPQVHLREIIEDIKSAIGALNLSSYKKVTLIGHSAGAYLAACFPADHHILYGGVYDLRPIQPSIRNEKIVLSPADAVQLTLSQTVPSKKIEIIVGGLETPQFKAQSAYYAQLNHKHAVLKEIPNCHHFNLF